MKINDREEIEAEGFEFVKNVTLPTYPEQVRIAREKNVELVAVRGFRLGTYNWAWFIDRRTEPKPFADPGSALP